MKGGLVVVPTKKIGTPEWKFIVEKFLGRDCWNDFKITDLNNFKINKYTEKQKQEWRERCYS